MQAKSLWLRNRRLFRLATLIIFWLSSSALCFTSEPTCFPVSSPWIWTLKNAEIKVWVIHTIGDWDSLMVFENQSSDGGWWTMAPDELFLKRYCHHYCLPALSLLWLWRRPKLTREYRWQCHLCTHWKLPAFLGWVTLQQDALQQAWELISLAQNNTFDF